MHSTLLQVLTNITLGEVQEFGACCFCRTLKVKCDFDNNLNSCKRCRDKGNEGCAKSRQRKHTRTLAIKKDSSQRSELEERVKRGQKGWKGENTDPNEDGMYFQNKFYNIY